MDAIGLSPQEAGKIVGDIWITQYTLLAAAAVLICEYIATIDDERRLIWSSRLTIPKIMFFINRYVPFATVAMIMFLVVANKQDTFCKTGFYIGGMFSTIQYVIAEAILYFRAYAVWGHNSWLAIFLTLSLLCSTISGFYITILFINGVVVAPVRLLRNGCMFSFTDQIEWISLAVVIYCETLTLSVLLYKTYSQYRHCLRVQLSPILSTMIRDGVFFYVCILVTSIANIVILIVARPTLRNFLLIPQGVIHSVLCNRLLLHIRGAYESICDRSLALSLMSFAAAAPVSTPVVNAGSRPGKSCDTNAGELSGDSGRNSDIESLGLEKSRME